MSNKKVVGIILLSLFLSFVGFVTLLYFFLPKFPINEVFNRTEKTEEENIDENAPIIEGDLPTYSLDGLAHIESDEMGDGKIFYTDFNTKSELRINLVGNPIEIAQVYGGRWIVVNTSQHGVIVIDKVSGNVEKLEIPKIENLSSMVMNFVYGSISWDGKHVILNVGYSNLLGTEADDLGLNKSILYLYNIEKKETTKLIETKGEYSPLGYTWSIDSKYAYVVCPSMTCSDFEGLNGIIKLDIEKGKYSQIEKPKVDNARLYVQNGKYILGNNACCDLSQNYVEVNGKQKRLDSGNFTQIQNPTHLSKDNRYALYEKQAGDLTDGIPYFDLMLIDIEKQISSILIKGEKTKVLGDFNWISDKELAYTSYSRNEEGFKISTKVWNIVNIETKEVRSVLK